ncbi:uncharacterized protein [Watersipora subatra]|uniref:uncharacterized protein n=1 Tax=Watersipora subatra TaxID=2589382 RepID=UPI00355C68B5
MASIKGLTLRLPFVLYTSSHLYLAARQLTERTGAPPLVALPLLVVTLGCSIDNFRLTLGVGTLGKCLTYISYFLHLVVLPILVFSTVIIMQDFTGGLKVGAMSERAINGIAILLVAGLTIDGFYMFFQDVYQNIVVKPSPTNGLNQYGLIKTPPRFLLGVIVLSLSLLISTALWWKQRGEYSHFLVQIICFIGQAATPAVISRTWLMQAMNAFEVVVIADMMSITAAVY